MLRIDIDVKRLEKLGNWLRESNYSFIYQSMAGIFNSVEPWIEESLINKMLLGVSEINKHIVEFLLLGCEKDKQLLLSIFGKDNLMTILDMGFAIETGSVVKPEGYVILPVGKLFLIVSLPSCYRNAKKKISDIYIGSDSTKLMKYVKKEKYNKVLDLCAGSGVQGLNIVDYANKVVEVELNDVAYSTANLNGKMNGISSEKYEVRKGDLYSCANERFDCIISNPPFVPVPKDIVFPLCGDGGEDGLDLVRRIVAGYDEHLETCGKAYMVLECIGDEEKPYVVDCMKEFLKRGIINVSLINRQQIEFQADASAKIAIEIYNDPENYDKYYNSWMDMFNRTNAVYIYPVIIEYIKTDRPLEINYIRNYNDWSLDSSFEIKNNVSIEQVKQKYYGAYVEGIQKATFDEEVKDLLMMDKEKSIRQYLEVGDNPKKYIGQIKKTLNTLYNLEKRGLISHK